MLGFLPTVGPWELIAILFIVLLVFGPGKLPELGKFLGKGVKEFKSAVKSTEKNKIKRDSEIIKDIREEDIIYVDDKNY